MSDYNDEQTGPAIWADDPTPVAPPLRTFRVVVEDSYGGVSDDIYIHAHSVTCLDDAAHFYVYRPTQTAEGVMLAAYAVRTLRPYLDVEDISDVLATTSNKLN